MRAVVVASFLGLGCGPATHRTGFVVLEADRPTLVESTGLQWGLWTPGDASWLAALEGCGVEVHGPRVGRKLWARQWRVFDAGDGSAPFVGPLKNTGLKWYIDDHNSGSQVFLEPHTLGD